MSNIEQCPEAIAKAINQVTKAVQRISKDSQNEHHKYKFAGIDAFYEAVRDHLSDAGLSIICTEDSANLSPDGKTLKMQLSFILVHESGATWLTPIKRTIYTQYGGAQSCGTALSYAEKFVMRGLFKIPTGDADDLELSPDADLPSDDADAQRKPSKGQEPEADFSYAGSPFRVFKSETEIVRQFTELSLWSSTVERTVLSATAKKHNKNEAIRILRDLPQMSVTAKVRDHVKATCESIIEGETNVKN